MPRFPHEFGENVKCMDGATRRPFVVSMCIDESMMKTKSVSDPQPETSVDDLLDLLDLELEKGATAPTVVMGRGKELLVEPGTVFFLEVQNRDVVKAAHVKVTMNGDVQGVWRLRPNEKLNIRHPALANKNDLAKWAVDREEDANKADVAAGKSISHTNRISRSGKINGKRGTVEIQFEPENNQPNTKTTKRNRAVPEDGEELLTAYGKAKVAPVVSSTYRMAVQPPADKSAAGVGGDDLQKLLAAQGVLCGESAGITQSGQMFSKLLYKPANVGLDVDEKLSYTETFSFQIGKSEGESSDAPSKKAKLA